MKIQIKGVIVPNDLKWIYDWFEMDAISPKDVSQQIESANGEDLEVEINSHGGDVYSGSEIYTALKDYKGNVTVKIVGVAASAASVVAMSGHVLISPTAQIMMHNVSSGTIGDYRDHRHESEVLKNFNISIANAYMLKTGMKQEELLSFMNKETWLNAQQALEYKFADEIMFDEGMQLTAISQNYLIPKEVVNKIRNLVNPEDRKTKLPPPDPTWDTLNDKLVEFNSLLDNLPSATKDQLEQAWEIFNEINGKFPEPEEIVNNPSNQRRLSLSVYQAKVKMHRRMS